MKKNSLRTNLIIHTIDQLLIVALPLITAPYTSRALQPEGVGTVSFLSSIVGFFTMLALLGTAGYGILETARVRSDKQELSNTFWGIEIVTIISTAIALLLWGIVISFTPENRVLFLIYSVAIVSCAFDVGWFYIGVEKIVYNVVVLNVFRILSFVLILLFVKTKDDVWKYILITTGCAFLGSVLSWLPLRKYIMTPQFKKLSIKRHFKSTLAFFIPTVAAALYSYLDKILIGIITQSNFESGYYEQAFKIVKLSKTFSFTAMSGIVGSRMSFLFAKNDYEDAKNKMKFAFDYSSFIGVGCCAGIIAIASIFVPVFFGKEYQYVSTLLPLFSPVIVISSISSLLSSVYLNAIGKRLKSAVIIICGNVLNLMLSIPLIIWLGSKGAIIATIIAEIAISVTFLIVCRSFFKPSKLIDIYWKKIFAGFVMCATLMFIKHYFATNVINVIILICIGFFEYSFILFLLNDDFIDGIFDNVKKSITQLFSKKS